MAAFLFLQLLIFAMATRSSAGATWCICKEGISDNVLQKTIDYACGAGADCNQIHQNGACFNPNTVRAHCNYAVNSYFQKKTQTSGSCDFSGTAMLLTSNPSSGGCVYPATASATITTPGSTTSSASTATPTNKAPAGTTPLITPSTGVLGGINNGGLGPAFYPDDGGILILKSSILLSTMVTSLSSAVLVFLWA